MPLALTIENGWIAFGTLNLVFEEHLHLGTQLRFDSSGRTSGNHPKQAPTILINKKAQFASNATCAQTPLAYNFPSGPFFLAIPLP